MAWRLQIGEREFELNPLLDDQVNERTETLPDSLVELAPLGVQHMLKMTLKTFYISCLLVSTGVAVAALATRKPPAEPPTPAY